MFDLKETDIKLKEFPQIIRMNWQLLIHDIKFRLERLVDEYHFFFNEDAYLFKTGIGPTFSFFRLSPNEKGQYITFDVVQIGGMWKSIPIFFKRANKKHDLYPHQNSRSCYEVEYILVFGNFFQCNLETFFYQWPKDLFFVVSDKRQLQDRVKLLLCHHRPLVRAFAKSVVKDTFHNMSKVPDEIQSYKDLSKVDVIKLRRIGK